MHTRIVIGPGDPHFLQKLQRMAQIDPSIGGGISSIVLGRRVLAPDEAIGPVSRSGYEEIHEIERGFCLHIVDSFIEQDWRLTILSRENNVRFRIAFAGAAAYFDRKHQLSERTLGVSYIIRPAGDELTASFKGGMQYRYCSVNVTEEYLTKTLGLAEDELPSMLLSHWQRNEAVMGHFSASRATLALAHRFFDTRSSSGWRDLELRAIASDLLRVLFDTWQNAKPSDKSSMRLTHEERDKLDRIRDRIQDNPADAYTISSLCAQFRINRKKLHYGFKRLCGVSIHEFQTELRMQLAMSLLQSRKLSIAQVAERCGFSEPTNFTAAFKKHYAALPKQVREAQGD